MEPLTAYLVTHGCLVAGCWLLTYAEQHTLPPPHRYLGSNQIAKKPSIGVRTTQLWF